MRILAVVATLTLLVAARPAAALTDQILLTEVLASWQGDDRVQFVEVVIRTDGNAAIGGGLLGFDDHTGNANARVSFTIPSNVANGAAGARILFATNQARTVAGVTPDFILPDDTLDPDGGRVCYRIPSGVGGGDPTAIDCIAYGSFAGANGAFGKPIRITPDNRSLDRTGASGINRSDWIGRLDPTPTNNAGQVGAGLTTLCGNDRVDQGEVCDGEQLAGKDCADLGFVKGKLRCSQCHFDTSRCTFCGNAEINPGEQCDGDELDGSTCAKLGFTGGALACGAACKFATATCDPTFYVPGGGPAVPDCLAEWRITNGSQRPGGDGIASTRQRCQDGDPECDADAVDGQCTFSVAVCVNRVDPRLARGTRACKTAPVSSMLLRAKPTTAAGLLGLATSVGSFGPSIIAGSGVSFDPPLDSSERCTVAAPLAVPRGGKVALRSRTVGLGLRDQDRLTLSCTP